MKRRFYAIAATVITAVCAYGQTDISEEECADMIVKYGKRIQIVDVRTKAEYDLGHIDDAVLIDWKGGNFENEAKKKLNKRKRTIVYCRSGVRSSAAMKKMNEMGFKRVYNMRGGYKAWSSKFHK